MGEEHPDAQVASYTLEQRILGPHSSQDGQKEGIRKEEGPKGHLQRVRPLLPITNPGVRPGGTLKYHILTKAGPLLSLHLDYWLPDESKTGRQRGDHLVAIRKNVATINSFCLLTCHQAQVLSSRLKQGIPAFHSPDV